MKGPVQVAEILANQVSEAAVAKDSNDTIQAPSFAVRMKPVVSVFNIKHKASPVLASTTQQLTKVAVTNQTALSSNPTAKQENGLSSSALHSLGLAYGSSEDDSK